MVMDICVGLCSAVALEETAGSSGLEVRSDENVVSTTLSDCEVTAAGDCCARPAPVSTVMLIGTVEVTAVSFWTGGIMTGKRLFIGK